MKYLETISSNFQFSNNKYGNCKRTDVHASVFECSQYDDEYDLKDNLYIKVEFDYKDKHYTYMADLRCGSYDWDEYNAYYQITLDGHLFYMGIEMSDKGVPLENKCKIQCYVDNDALEVDKTINTTFETFEGSYYKKKFGLD